MARSGSSLSRIAYWLYKIKRSAFVSSMTTSVARDTFNRHRSNARVYNIDCEQIDDTIARWESLLTAQSAKTWLRASRLLGKVKGSAAHRQRVQIAANPNEVDLADEYGFEGIP